MASHDKLDDISGQPRRKRRIAPVPVDEPADQIATADEEKPRDLDDAAVQDDILAPGHIDLPITVGGEARQLRIPLELSIAIRKRVLRQMGSWTALVGQEVANRVPGVRLSVEFLNNPANRNYLTSALFADGVRRLGTEILATICTYANDDPKIAPRPTFDELDDGMEDRVYLAATEVMFALTAKEQARLKNSVTEPASG